MNRSAAWSLMAAMGSFAFVAAGATNTFESAEGTTEGERPAEWTGYCVVSNQVGSYAKTPPGNPAADATHARVLWVEGSAAREYAESGNRVVDLLVMAEEWPDEELPTADGNEQIKFAFDTNGYVNLYHKLASGDASAAWRVVSSEAIPAGTWVRTTFTFDYTSNLCQLKLDGSPCVSEYGYRSADNLTHPGSWYYMAKSDAATLASIDFVGCGGVDDVINAAKDAYTPAHDGATATNGVDYAWFDKNGLAWSDPDATAAPGGSGYTLKESFQAGTDPCSADKLYVTNATYTATKLTLTINGCGKTYEVEKSEDPFVDGAAGTVDTTGSFTYDVAANTTTWEGDFPTGDLTYYRVRSTSASTAETVNQFAIKKISSSAATTLIALPWKSLCSDTNNPAAITAANVMMTKNLVNGDWLLYYDGGYKGWCLTGGVWTPTEIASLNGTAVSAAAENAELARGQAIWLVRTTANDRDLSQPFYLYGQYQAALGSTTISTGGNLLASPNMGEAFTISSSTVAGVDGDVIEVPASTPNTMPTRYENRNGTWGHIVETTETIGNRPVTTQTWTTDSGMTVPIGQGFKYITGQGSGTRSINW